MADKTPQELQQEAWEIERRLTQVQLAATDLDVFSEYTFPGYDSAPHQKLLSQHLMEVEKYITSGGKEGIGRLLVEMPPRHGKSEKATIRFPAFFFGRNPDRKVILASYSDAVAQRFSRGIRDTIEGDRYQEIFGKTSLSKEHIQLNPDGRSIESWNLLNHRGELNAAGIGGGITSKGADLFIIDDPVKGRAEADSPVYRQEAKEWYGAVAYTRLEPHGAIVMCLTRWHKDDLAGHVLSLDDGWTRLRLPALAEENDPMGRKQGDPLWPNKWGLQALERTRKNLPTRDWNALYQQNPTDEEGDVFNMNWFTYGDFPPEDEIVQGFQVWDTAFTEDEANDPCACTTFYITTWGVFIAHVLEDHLSFDQLERKVAEHYNTWNKKRHLNRVFVEYKGSGISIVQTLRKKLKHIPIMEVKPDSEYGKSKLARAQSVTGYLESGNVQFQRNAAWLAKFEEQLTSFPRGKHDDMVDTFVYGIMRAQGGGKKKRSSEPYYAPDNLNDRHSQILGQGFFD